MSITRLKKWPKSVRPEDQVQDPPPATDTDEDAAGPAEPTGAAATEASTSDAPAESKRKGTKKK